MFISRFRHGECRGPWQVHASVHRDDGGFYDCGGNLCGKIVAVTNEANKSTVGKLIVDGAKPSGEGAWKGNIFEPETGKTYKGTMTLAGDGLKLQGCVMKVICSGEVWKRAK